MEDTKNINPDQTRSIEEKVEPQPSKNGYGPPKTDNGYQQEAAAPPELVTSEKIKSDVQSVVKHILALMEIRTMVRINATEEDYYYYVNIRSRNADSLLIGKRGITALSIQVMVNQIMRHRYPNLPIDVFVDVSGYRKRHENFLLKKALAIAKVVVDTKRDMALDILTEKEFGMVEKELVPLGTVRVHAIGTGPRKTVIIAPL